MNYIEFKEKVDQYAEELWQRESKMSDEDLPVYGVGPLEEAYKVFQVLKEDVEAELYRIQHPERCPPGDPMCPQQELTCPTCDGATVVLDIYKDVVNCPRCG